MNRIRIGLLAFPHMTQLDLTGPYEVLARIPGAEIHIVADSLAPVVTDLGLAIVPTTTLAKAPLLDVVLVPGGPGADSLLRNDTVLDYLVDQAAHARFLTSVCTGALVLGAAGLLRGYRATTHWLAMDLLPIFGAIPVTERVVVDRNRITGGGVTAGIDFGFTVATELAGERAARTISLAIEYDPQPPFPGSPRAANRALVETITAARAQLQAERRAACLAAAARRAEPSEQ